jgi:ABC-type uncharacterized transport system involved in gliding motility auxiliary subunit
MRRGSGHVLPLVVGVVGLIACGAVVLLLTYRHNVRLDLSPQRAYTLSTHARKILAGLDRDVRLTVFVRSEDPRTPELKDLLWRVAAASKHVSYEFIDLNRSPALAKRYDIDRYGAIVVESGSRRRDISNASESLLMGALLSVTRERERVVYFLTGHGERSPDDADRKQGLSIAKRTLEDDHFTVRVLQPLGATGVPADATVLVLAGPRKDYLPGEIDRIDTWVRNGGNLLVLVDPELPASVADLLSRVGIGGPDRVIVDPERRLAGGEGVTLMLSDMLRSFLVSGSLEAPPVFSSARPLDITAADTSATVAFLKSSASSYPAAPDAPAQRLAGTSDGALVAGVALFPAEGRPGRVIVLGDSDFASNGVVDYLGNKDLLLNSVNWLAREESLLAARAQSKEVGREQFFVTETQGAFAFWAATVLQPAFFFGVATLVILRRRRQ